MRSKQRQQFLKRSISHIVTSWEESRTDRDFGSVLFVASCLSNQFAFAC
ncbi:MAG TPA: hypothetical protein VE398_06170 [Acidobacteriota bacterium]|nr:hypothetical protein [Acidobacteriota bacterium]